MQCRHCDICRASNKCTKVRHTCREFVEKEAIKDIKPVRWKLSVRK